MTNLGDELMKVTYEIIRLEKDLKFVNEINSISVKPDLSYIKKHNKQRKLLDKKLNSILDKMKMEKEDKS